MIRYFQEADVEAVSFDELIDEMRLREDSPGDRNQLALTVHHVTLPKLADADVIAYDTQSQVVRYHGHPLLTQVLQLLPEPDGGSDD